jgi:uncharacterized membrane protein
MKFNKKDAIILVVPIVIAMIIYPMLPPEIPRQFSFSGKVNSYMNKEFIFLLSLLPYVAYKYKKFRSK